MPERSCGDGYTHRAVHDGEHLLYLAVGYLYLLPLFGDEPIRCRLSQPAKMVMSVISMPIHSFTSA